MKPYQRVARTYLKRSSQVTYIETSSWDFESDSLIHVIELILDKHRVGEFGATLKEIGLEDLKEYRCQEDMEILIEQNPSLMTANNKIYVAEVVTSLLDPDQRKKGLGVKGYLKLASFIFEKTRGKPFLLIPNYCSFGRTSQSAMRVWNSLSKKYKSEYDVVLIDRG